MPYSSSNFTLIIPFYNPGAATVRRTFGQLAEFVRTHPSWMVLFVSDGCTDGSNELLRGLIRTGPAKILLTGYTPNHGKGYAVRRGMLQARTPYRVFTDFDLSYHLDQVQAVGERLARGADVVIASRAHPQSVLVTGPEMHHYLRRRKIQSSLFYACSRCLLGLEYRDTQAGLKGFSARAARRVFRFVHCQGFAFDTDVLMACEHLGFQVKEMPVRVHYDRRETTLRPTTSLRMLRELVGIRQYWLAVAARNLLSRRGRARGMPVTTSAIAAR